MNMHAPEMNKPTSETAINTHLASLFGIVADQLEQVRKCIVEQLNTSYKPLNDLCDHITARRGKMLRPALVQLAGKCCGPTTQTHIDIATIVELIHAATLLHDDVIDEARYRRNAATVNSLWGNESAVLLGDFLLSKVFVMCARLELPQIAQTLSDTAVQMCKGELLQNIQRQNWQLSEAGYLEIVKGKTASLFHSCCYLGGLAAAGSERRLCALSEYGLNLGTAFQITDDLLDIIGDEASEGKTLGTDFAKCKPTLPIIHLLNAIEPQQKSGLIERLSTDHGPEQLAQMLENLGSVEYTRATIKKLCQRATESLKPLENSPAKAALVGIAGFISQRCD
jgi:octaprenyl-diphosphate synthase